MPDPQPKGLAETARLVLSLRFRLFARRMTTRGLWGTAVAVLLALGLSGGLGVGSYLLFSAVAGIASSPVWMAFSMGLFVFLLGLFWVIWPVIAAQVDEAYEMGRFFTYPVRPARLYLIQSLTALFEPSVLFFYPALIGFGLGLADSLGPGWGATLGLILCYALMNVACGRFLQNVFLNVMTSRRSGEFLFAAFLVFLGGAAFIPAVDASWLFARLGAFGDSPQDVEILARTAVALGNTPPGWLAKGLAAAAAGQTRVVFGCAAMMMTAAAVTWLLGLWFLKRYYRGGKGWRLLPSGKKRPEKPQGNKTGWRVPWVSKPVAAVFEKELKTLVSNPKARLLFAVPFFLLILLKIIGAPQLFLYLWGDAWAAVFLSLLGVYVLSVLSGQFFSNGFGYDGHGVRQVFTFPAPLRDWLVGRNLAQGLFAVVQFEGLWILLFLAVPEASSRGMLLPVFAFPFGLLISLGVGNLLSVRHPRRFQFDLSRRDRPVGASFVVMLLVLGGCTLLVLGALAVSGGSWALLPVPLILLLGLSLLVYRWLLPVAARMLASRREELIDTLTS